MFRSRRPGWRPLPLVGPRLHEFWSDLAAGSVEATAKLEPYVQYARARILGFGALIGSGVVEIFISLLIAFFLYRDGQRAAAALGSVLERLAGRRGPRLLDVAAGTLKGVVYGIIGTNLTEAILAAIGFRIAGVPGALLLGFFCFFLTLVPVGPVLIWLPATIWLFTIGETGWAIFLIVWSIMVFGVLEALLRTFLVSRGSDLPMILILLGPVRRPAHLRLYRAVPGTLPSCAGICADQGMDRHGKARHDTGICATAMRKRQPADANQPVPIPISVPGERGRTSKVFPTSVPTQGPKSSAQGIIGNCEAI